MKPYPEYKETGLAWLPKIPKHWDWVMLSQIATEQCSRNTERTENNVLSLSYGHVIRKKNLYSGLSPQDYGTYQIICSGNIIMRLTDLQNDHRSLRTGLVEERGIITSAYTCLRTDHNPAFLHYLLHSYDVKKVFYGLGGGVRQSIGFKDIRGLRFPLPSPEEQAQIVRYLDAMTAKINKLIRAKKKQVALLQEQKQAIINQAVTKGLDPHAEMKDSGIDWLGPIPKHWTMRTVKSVSGILPGYAFASDEFSTQGKYLLLRGINIGVSGINKDAAVYWNKEITGITHFLLQENDLVLGLDRPWISGGLRIFPIASTDLPCLLVQRVCRIRTNGDCFNKFLLYALRSNIFLNTLSSVTSGISVPHISTSQVGSVKIPLPSPAEQNEIITFIESELGHIEDLINKVQDGIFLIKEYKNSLISKIITGQLDVRNIVVESIAPNDLSDEELDETEEESTIEKEV